MQSKREEKMKEDEKTGTSISGEGFDIEPLLLAFSPRGLSVYQVLQMILQLVCLFGVPFSIVAIVFIGFKPDYRCATANVTKLQRLAGWENSTANVTVEYQQCSIQMMSNSSGQIDTFSLPCVEGFEYEGGNKYTSVFTEWDLTCEKSSLTEVSQTLMMVGQGAGAFIFTSLADRFGRKPVYIGSSVGMLVIAVAIALSPNFYFFVFCRIIIGGLQQGSGLVGFTMFIELLPKDMRLMAGMIDGGVWSMGMMLLPGLAYMMDGFSWRYLQLVMAAFSAYSLILPFCMDESLRWLVANKKKSEAERVLKKACRVNRLDYPRVQLILHSILNGQETEGIKSLKENGEKLLGPEVSSVNANEKLEKLSTDRSVTSDGEPFNEKNGLQEPINGDVTTTASTEEEKVKKYTLMDILKSRLLLKTTFVIAYMWITCSLTYYGLMLTSAKVAGSRFLNFFLQALMEFPAFVTVYLCLRKFGRRAVTCGLLCLTSFALLLTSILIGTVTHSVIGPISNALSLIGKFAVSGSFCSLFIYCPELFPTNLRTAGLGISSAFARGGSMVAPYMYNLAEEALWAPWTLYAIMTSLAAYSVTKLPETRGREGYAHYDRRNEGLGPKITETERFKISSIFRKPANSV